jgi:enamine deaminase RidA (YjgF/YER057c/UK114 family)
MPADVTTPESRLKHLGITLPPVPEPKGLYKPLVVVGNMAYTSGHLPSGPDGKLITGRVGAELDEQAAAAAARQAGLAILATLRAALGSLDRVGRVVKLFGTVNCTPDFTRQPVVLNGCSQLLADVFGPDRGVGARTAVGVGSLPLGVPVEIEAVFELLA